MKAIAILILLCVAGCQSRDPIVRPGELYSEDEKAAMSTDEKTAKYNEQVEADDQIVCRRVAETGSRMHKTVCYSKEELERAQEQSTRTLDALKKNESR